MNRILHLTLKKYWFDLIKSGEKKVEYREIKEYWNKRLLIKEDGELKVKVFDFIIFKNGYGKNAPTMKVEWKETYITVSSNNPLGKPCYAIKLGDVIE